jgi:hypothetical protein
MMTAHRSLPILAMALASTLAATGARAEAALPPGMAPVTITQPAERALIKALSGVGAERDAAVDHVIAHPDAVNPIAFALVAEGLWARGDRQQAAFWYYLFQSRTLAWMSGAEQSTGDLLGVMQSMMGEPVTYIAARRALNRRVGAPINAWAFSDLDAVKALALRVFAYEKHMPLYPGRPEGVSEADWAALVAKERAGYEADFHEVFGDTDAKAYYKNRRDADLYVGPWQAPGKPLPDSWR